MHAPTLVQCLLAFCEDREREVPQMLRAGAGLTLHIGSGALEKLYSWLPGSVSAG